MRKLARLHPTAAQDARQHADTPNVSIAPARPAEALTHDLDRARRTRAQVEQLIADPSLLGPDFAPIRRLETSAPGLAPLLGWKATGRGRPGTDVADTLTLLAHASALGLVERLDWAFRAHTFDVMVDSGVAGELHLTPEPETFGTPCPPRLAVAVLRGRRALDVCAELHEDAFADERRLLAAVDEMVGWGWQTVIADIAARPTGPAAMRLMSRIRPAYVHVDLSQPARLSDPGRSSWIDSAVECGAQVIALGVDTTRDLESAVDLGASYARGALIGATTHRPR